MGLAGAIGHAPASEPYRGAYRAIASASLTWGKPHTPKSIAHPLNIIVISLNHPSGLRACAGIGRVGSAKRSGDGSGARE